MNTKLIKLMTSKIGKRAFIQKRLYFYHFLNDGITFVLPTLMVSFFIAFNLNWFQVGLIFGFNALAMIGFQIIIGYYTDKDISEKLMKVGILLLALTSFLMIFSFDFLSLLIFSIFSGIALSFQHSISYATISRMYQENRDVMIGRQGAAGDMGKCVAIFSSALILIIFASWQLVLLLWSITAFLIFVLISYNLRNIKFKDFFLDTSINITNENNFVKNSEKKFESTAILFLVIAYILYAAIFSILIINLATYLRVEKTGLVSEFSGLILGFTIIFGILGAYTSGICKSKLGLTNSLIIFGTFLIFILTFYLIIDTSDLLITLIFFAIIGFFLFLIYPQLLATVNDIFRSKKVGFFFGIVLSIGWFGNFLGSLIGGYFADIYSANVFFVLSIIWFLIIICLSVMVKIKHKI